MSTTSTEVTIKRILLPADICDRCCAKAMVAYQLESGNELMFCAHHAVHLPVEVTINWTVVGVGTL